MKGSQLNDHEALREALLNVDRLREQERTARLKMEALIGGIHVLNECQNVSDMYREILDCLGGLLSFDAAAILVEDNGVLSSAMSSDERLRFRHLPITGCFRRCLDGRATNLSDLSVVADWPSDPQGTGSEPAEPGQALQSALLIALPSAPRPMMLACASDERARFKKKDVELLRSFAPLATQAVRRAMEMERLNYLASTLDHQAHFDQLSGLPNRVLFHQELERLEGTGDVYSLLFIDLDNFKTVNDTFGHGIGDVLLSEMAFRMSMTLHDDDTVARLGGDEFALIIRSRTTIDGVTALCEDLLQELSEPLYLRNSRVVPTVSIGVLFAPEQKLLSQQKMQRADIALYDAKARGRNRYSLFDDTMRAKVELDFEIESRLPGAIRRRAFHLVYQPMFESSTMRCDRLEALVRWQEDEHLSYAPSAFIPIAERTGNIVELGQWIIGRALAELSDWLNASSTRVLSLNVSQVELQSPGYTDGLLKQVEAARVDCRQLELELSENIVARSLDGVVSRNLLQLQRVGIRFAFDDFGTGSSSLLHIKRFPGNCLKIDRAFVDDIVGSSKQRRLLIGMIEFAHHMGMFVVAEGVESREQLELLMELGADYVQGFILARPDLASRTVAFLDDWNRTRSASPVAKRSGKGGERGIA